MQATLAQFDQNITDYVRSLPVWWDAPMHWLSLVAQPAVLIGVLVVIALLGFVQRRTAWILGAVLAGAWIAIGSLLKQIIQRERPMGAFESSTVLDMYSFPSGHALAAVLVLGLVTYLVWGRFPSWKYRAPLLLVLVALALAVSVSRVYLGVHYPSDVAAGMLLGLLGIWSIIWVMRQPRYQTRTRSSHN